MRRVFASVAVLLCVWSLVGAPAQATPIQETLTISGAQFLSGGIDAGTLSGTLSYHYDPTTLLAISLDSVSLIKTAGIGGSTGLYDYKFHVPGVTDTATVKVFNETPSGVLSSCRFHILSLPAFSPQLYLEIVGTGTTAHLAIADPVLGYPYVSCSGSKGNGCDTLGFVGTTLAVVETVPEPASLVLLGAGVAALGLVCRRRAVRLA